MADHHDAYNSMLQMNGLGLVHHLNGAPQPPPPVEMNGSVPQDVHRNGNTTPGQHQQNSGTLPLHKHSTRDIGLPPLCAIFNEYCLH